MKWVLGLWCIVLLAISVRVSADPTSRTVYPIFSSSARLFAAGADLYEPHRSADVPTGYRYSPTFALLLTPFAALPDDVGGIAWRCFGVIAYLLSLAWFARAVLPDGTNVRHLAILFLLIVPLSIPSINNGQSNVHVIALLLATVAATAQQRWNLAALFSALAFACKIYPLALGLLLAILYPRQLLPRLGFALAFVLAIPFVLHDSGYVADQYAKWFACLAADQRNDLGPTAAYRDLWLLVLEHHLPIRHEFYVGLQLLSALALAALCLQRQRAGWVERTLLIETFALATCWMLLLGPATESCTFILMAPSFAWAGVCAWRRGSRIELALLLLPCALFLASGAMSWFPPAYRCKSLPTWATLVCTLILFLPRRHPETSTQPIIDRSGRGTPEPAPPVFVPSMEVLGP